MGGIIDSVVFIKLIFLCKRGHGFHFVVYKFCRHLSFFKASRRPTLPSAGKDFVNLMSAVYVCTRTGYGKFVILVNNILKTGKIELDMFQ